jgi:hypothetical protein
MKAIEKIKSNYWIILLSLMVIVFFKQCSMRNDIDRMEKNVRTLTEKTDSIQNNAVTRDQIKYEMNQTMFNFLIYEDDFDRGRTSLSDIRNKINKGEQ